MNREPAQRAWTRWTLGLLAAGAIAAAVLTGRTQASGAPGSSPVPPPDTVVLTGSYSCSVLSYSIVPPYPPVPAPTPEPGSAPAPDPETDEPAVVRELTHFVSISGTGALTSPPGVPPIQAIGPGFGGRDVRGGFLSTPVSLGSGVSAGFDGGTAEDCVRFGEAVAAVANGLGCMTSPLRTRQGVPIATAEARFSFVCEGPAASEIHTVGELDRAVLAQRPASAP